MSQIKVDKKTIRSLAQLLDETGLTEIEIADGDKRLRLSKLFDNHNKTIALAENNDTTTALNSRTKEVVSSQENFDSEISKEQEINHSGGVTSPLVGTVYRSPEPGASPFITEGDIVEEGQTLLIVEAMKTMNPIKAPRAGRVSKIFVENASPIEFGELLVIIEQ
tara:strand:+ start:4937 stop:5431 length:495 start_codon:yes stop_codon:yes gene_type:complete